MRDIVVPIDFSECSYNALEHAITIANKAKSNLIMVWVNTVNTHELKYPVEADDILAEAIKKFNELVEKYKGLMEHSMIDYKIREGKTYKEIVAEARERDAFLIVCGTHGLSGFEEFWIGSNAYKIVSSSTCPVITIRGGVNISRDLTKIVLPIDSTLETRQKVPYAVSLAKIFDAAIYVVPVYSTTVKAVRMQVDEYAHQVVKNLEEKGIQNHLEAIEADNISTSIIEYAKKIEANLIVIMTEQEKKAANLWLGPYAQQMVNHSPIPVLSVHSKELIKVLGR